MADLTLKQHDLEPALFATIYGSDGAPVILEANVLTLTLRFADHRRKRIWLRTAEILDGATGRVVYRWQTGDTDAPGLYFAEFVVTWTGSRPQTYPTSGYLVIVIEPDLE